MANEENIFLLTFQSFFCAILFFYTCKKLGGKYFFSVATPPISDILYVLILIKLND